MAPFLNLVGFIAGTGCFARFFLRSIALGWGWTALVNIPNLLLIYKLLNPEKHGNDLAALLTFITVFGGFGIGAILGMIIAFVIEEVIRSRLF